MTDIPDDVIEAALDAFEERWRDARTKLRNEQEFRDDMRRALAAAAAMWRAPETAVKDETVLAGIVHEGKLLVSMAAWVGPLSTHWESRDPFSHGFGMRKPDMIRAMYDAAPVTPLNQTKEP